MVIVYGGGDAAEAICKQIIAEFDESIPEYYNKNDLDKGFVTTRNRHGIEEDFPLLSISISGVSSQICDTIYKLSECMAKMKRRCKQIPGSNYIMDA